MMTWGFSVVAAASVLEKFSRCSPGEYVTVTTASLGLTPVSLAAHGHCPEQCSRQSGVQSLSPRTQRRQSRGQPTRARTTPSMPGGAQGARTSALLHGRTRAGSAPISSNTARARSYQLACPRWSACSVDATRGVRAARVRRRPPARSTQYVGDPIWSSTTLTVRVRASSLRIVATKSVPDTRVHPRGTDDGARRQPDSRTAISPASLVRP